MTHTFTAANGRKYLVRLVRLVKLEVKQYFPNAKFFR